MVEWWKIAQVVTILFVLSGYIFTEMYTVQV